ncbi:hypothetical protein CCR75_004137 [Bremia lactucae]|uniref:Aldehyde dehydrogenase domain-containing protein n=1 Tax=Bremia lactucae TaxID=4779 RepID=A0A976ICN8_BRELC|nr:hypothetical protein CCR75_004137 [Bremia lactucae]
MALLNLANKTVRVSSEEDMTIARDEIVGPVMSIIKFETIDEIIARANNSEFGLGAGIVTSNLDIIPSRFSMRCVGTLYVN